MDRGVDPLGSDASSFADLAFGLGLGVGNRRLGFGQGLSDPPNDGRILRGSSLQIVRQMQGLAMDWGEKPLRDYVVWAASRWSSPMEVSGSTDEELAASFVSEMFRVGAASLT